MGLRSSLRSVSLVVLLVLTTACSKSAADYAASGDAYIAEGKVREAIVEYRNAIQQEPQLGEVRLKLAKAFEQINEPQNAAIEYVRAADLLPSSVEAQTKAASFLLLGGQFLDAKSRADKAIALDGKNVDAQLVRASAMANLKDIDGAIREMEEAIKLDPTQPRMYGSLAALEMAKGNPTEAEAAFRRAVEIAPKSVLSHLALGNFLWMTKRQAEAETSFRQALDIEPKNLLANRALAVFYITTNRNAEAEATLKTLSTLTPDGSGALALADFYGRSNRLAEARTVLEGLSANPALFSESRRRLAALLFLERKPVEAQKVVDEVLAKNAKDGDALVLQSRLFQLQGKPDEALASARAATEANPNLVAGHYLLGELLAARGQTDPAIAAYSEVLRLSPRVAAAQVELARLNLLKSGGASASVDYAQQALANAPGNPIAQLVLVRGLLGKGEVSRAETEMHSLLKRYPKAASVQAHMGMVQVYKRNLPAAREYYDRAIALDPNLIDAIGGLTTLDISERRMDAARARLDAKLAANPNDPTLLDMSARTAIASGDMAGAERTLRKLIEVSLDRLSSYGLLAQIYMSQKKLEEAKTELTQLASKQPRPVGAQTMIGILLEQQGKTDEARKMYEQVLGTEPRAAVAANNLAWMMTERGDNLDVALKYAQVAKEILPDQPEVNDTLAWIYYKKDLATLAVAPLQLAIGKDPKNAVYHYRLGLVYLKTGDAAKAKQSLQQALSINPSFAGADDAKQKLGTL